MLLARLCMLLGPWLFAAPLVAQDGRDRPVRGAALNWVRLPGAEACVAPVELAARVEQRLGRVVFVRTGDAIIVIEGRVGPLAAGGFEMVLRVGDPDGTAYGSRELQVPSRDCTKLSELAALVIAITIRHEGVGSGIELPAEVAAQLAALFADEPAELDPAELPKSEPAQVENASSPQSMAAKASDRPRALFFIGELGARLSTGLQPSASVGPALRLGVARRGWGSAALTGSLGLADEQGAPGEARGQLRYQPWQVGLALCWEAARSRLSALSLCAEGAAGKVSVVASDFQVNLGSSKPFVEVAATASLQARVWGPTYLQLRVGAPLRVMRPAFQYQSSMGEPRVAYTLAPVGVSLELGLGLEL